MKLIIKPLLVNIVIIAGMLGLLFFGDAVLFILAYIAVFLFASIRTLLMGGLKRAKFLLILAFAFAMSMQIFFCTSIIFVPDTQYAAVFFLRRLIGIVLLLLPLAISHYLSVSKYAHLYLPSVSEAGTVSFSQIKTMASNIRKMGNGIYETGQKMSPSNIKEIAHDLDKHDSFHYVNSNSLLDEYFEAAENSLSDSHIYIVISNTGSAASDLISVFTQKEYNHASLSFDANLETIISYNGGDKLYPPGLNPEMLEYFAKKKDASILIYSLPCTIRQKRLLIDKVRKINTNGSAYNLLGLVLKYSHRPNIMFCSQFVYQMLELADLTYFEKASGDVRPTDLIELDYTRKLQFEYEIKL